MVFTVTYQGTAPRIDTIGRKINDTTAGTNHVSVKINQLWYSFNTMCVMTDITGSIFSNNMHVMFRERLVAQDAVAVVAAVTQCVYGWVFRGSVDGDILQFENRRVVGAMWRVAAGITAMTVCTCDHTRRRQWWN